MALDGRSDAPAAPDSDGDAGNGDAGDVDASDVADACREAGLVRVVGATSGESLAAVGLLGSALAGADVPFQARLVSPAPAGGGATHDAETSADLGATDADLTITVGRDDLPADHAIGAAVEGTTVQRAYAVAIHLDDADPVLGLAGAIGGGTEPPSRVREDAEAAGIERRPGVAVPTPDLAGGLAHTTLVHAPFSGDRDAAVDALGNLDLADEPTDDDRRRVASLVALAVAEAEGCPPQATRAVERALHPHVGGPFETVGGYADVLDGLARTQPGLGIAVALGRGDADDALDAWREHGTAVHRAVADADLERHDGVVVAHADAVDVPERLETVARLVRDFLSPEPTVLVPGADAVVLGTVADGTDATDVLADAIADEDETATVVGDASLATAAIVDGQDAVVEAVRRAVR